MGWMDFLANSVPLRPDFNNVKPGMGKRCSGGGCPYGGLIGPLGSWLGDLALWDLDEAR